MGQETPGEGLKTSFTSATSSEGPKGDTCALLAGAGVGKSSMPVPRFRQAELKCPGMW